MKWSDLQRDFEWDGSWRDIHVLECGMAGWRVHFFSIDTIELDLDPRDVSSQASLDLLLAFMRRLGLATAKRVILAPENMPDHPIFRYEPERDAFVRTPTEHGGR
ncbi:MAG: hypothetical protein U0625_07075 [Phycisphaerales bacterium]